MFQDLAAVLGRHGEQQPLATPPLWQQAYQSLLREYLRTCVGELPPERRVVAIRTVPCLCGDCAALNGFLADPSREVGRFPMGKARRRHVHSQLERHYIDCTHETERWSKPETLVVTKGSGSPSPSPSPSGSGSAGDAREKWEQRRRRAAAQLDAFGEARLRALLADQYEEIVGMEFLLGRKRELAPGLAAAAAAAASPAPAATTPPCRRKLFPVPDPHYRRVHDHPNKRSRNAPAPASASADPTARQLAELEAEIARLASATTTTIATTTTTTATNRGATTTAAPSSPSPLLSWSQRRVTPKSRSTAPRPAPPKRTWYGDVSLGPENYPIAGPASTTSRAARPPVRPVDSTWRSCSWGNNGGVLGGGAGVGAGAGASATRNVSSRSTSRGPASMTAAAAAPTVAGPKRKIVDIIDLTGED